MNMKRIIFLQYNRKLLSDALNLFIWRKENAQFSLLAINVTFKRPLGK